MTGHYVSNLSQIVQEKKSLDPYFQLFHKFEFISKKF